MSDDNTQVLLALRLKEAKLNDILNELQAVAKDEKSKQANNTYFRLLQMKKNYTKAKDGGKLQSAVSIISHLYSVAQKSLIRATTVASNESESVLSQHPSYLSNVSKTSPNTKVAKVSKTNGKSAGEFAYVEEDSLRKKGTPAVSGTRAGHLSGASVSARSRTTAVVDVSESAPSHIEYTKQDGHETNIVKQQASSATQQREGSRKTKGIRKTREEKVKALQAEGKLNVEAPEFKPTINATGIQQEQGKEAVAPKGREKRSKNTNNKKQSGSSKPKNVNSGSTQPESKNPNKEVKPKNGKKKNPQVKPKDGKKGSTQTKPKDGKKGSTQTKPKDGKKGSTQTKPKDGKKKKVSPESKPNKWWKIIDEVDPITMEPIAELSYPPFQLNSDGSTETTDTSVVHFFDGKTLAQYIVATGSFINPNNRQPLSRECCRRLDSYLRDHRLPRLSVTEAFDLSRVVEVATGEAPDEAARSRSEALRREATVLLGSLFQFQTYAPAGPAGRAGRRRGPTGTAQHAGAPRRLVHQEGNLTVVDGDAWEADDTGAEEMHFPDIQRANPVAAPRPAPHAGPTLSARAAYPPRPPPAAFPRTHAAPRPVAAAAAIWRQSGTAVKRAPTEAERRRQQEQQQQQEKEWRAAAAARKREMERPQEAWEHAPGSLATSRSSAGLLCPYLPKQVGAAREFGLNWVSGLEGKLFEFCGNQKKYLELGEMHASKRAFVHELCQHYWGMETASMYSEPHRVIMVNKTLSTRPPEITLLKALMDFPQIVDEPWTVSLAQIRQGNNGVGLWNIRGPGSTQPSTAQLSNALSGFARQSEYNFLFLDDHHIVLEFASNVRARKVHAALVGTAGRLGTIQFERAQWWPCGSEWASRQLHIAEESKREKLVAEKEEYRRRKQCEKNNLEKARMQQMTDAWDDDVSDEGNVNESSEKVASEKQQVVLTHAQRVAYEVSTGKSVPVSTTARQSTTRKKTAAPPNPFGVLDSSSDEEDDE